MSLFEKFSKALGRKPDEATVPAPDSLQTELAALKKDGRLHARFGLEAEGLASLRLEGLGLTGVLKDVSYGGFGVRFDVTPGDQRALEGEHQATLVILDREIRCKVTPIRVVKQHAAIFAGLCVIHETPATLTFLRDFIEPMRCGRSLLSIQEDIRSERFRGQEWTCLRGEGPTDLILRRGADALMEEAILTFKTIDAYAELTYRNGILRTGKELKAVVGSIQSMGSQMASTDRVDLRVLRQAIAILSASPTAIRPTVQPLLDEATKALRQQSLSAA